MRWRRRSTRASPPCSARSTATGARRRDGGALSGQLTRRRLLTAAGGSTLGVALGGAGFALGQRREDAAPDTVPFSGARQAGIVTPMQSQLVFAAFDLTARRAADLR